MKVYVITAIEIDCNKSKNSEDNVAPIANAETFGIYTSEKRARDEFDAFFERMLSEFPHYEPKMSLYRSIGEISGDIRFSEKTEDGGKYQTVLKLKTIETDKSLDFIPIVCGDYR